MERIDIISSVTKAYKASWDARAYLFKLALIPMLLKFICFTLATTFAGGEDASYLRFMLILLPALLAEGWMLAHLVRFLVRGDTWPYRATGDMDRDLKILTVRARGVLGGMLVFVLIHLVLGLMIAGVQTYMMPYIPEPGTPADTTVEIPMYLGVASIAMLAAMFWGFRLLWAYIPYALGGDIMSYLSAARGARTTMSMIALWILCLLPFVLGLNLIASIIGPVLGQTLGADAASFVIIFLTVATDTAKSLVTTAGMTFLLWQLYSGGVSEKI